MEGRNPVEDYKTINNELEKYSKKLAKRTQIIVANKIDCMTDESLFKELESIANKNNVKIFKISASTGEGIDGLMDYVSKILKTLPKEDLIEVDKNLENTKLYTLEEKEDFTVTKDKNKFIVEGEAIDKIIRRVNITDNESLFYLHKKLNEIGLNKKLRKLGIKNGDTVKIGAYEMEWED